MRLVIKKLRLVRFETINVFYHSGTGFRVAKSSFKEYFINLHSLFLRIICKLIVRIKAINLGAWRIGKMFEKNSHLEISITSGHYLCAPISTNASDA